MRSPEGRKLPDRIKKEKGGEKVGRKRFYARNGPAGKERTNAFDLRGDMRKREDLKNHGDEDE